MHRLCQEDSGSDSDTSGEEDEAPARGPEAMEGLAVDFKEKKSKVTALPAVEAEDEKNKDAAQLDNVKWSRIKLMLSARGRTMCL